jgi:hypothetical protein
MIDKIKKVSNPLTIIAIFAALAEINSTVALGLVQNEMQEIFIWFIIGFPTLLILLFFVTLNFNPKVIYAPSDFKDEENFIKTMGGNLQFDKVEYSVTPDKQNIENVKKQVEEAIKTNKDSELIPKNEKDLIAKANKFFEILLTDIQPLFEGKKLEKLRFGMKSSEFFLLDFSMPKDILKEKNIVNERHMIIKVNEERNSDKISLELIGEGIKETDLDKFSKRITNLITEIINSSTK